MEKWIYYVFYYLQTFQMWALHARLRKLITTVFSDKYALLSNTISGSVLFLIGDAIEQKLEMRRGLQTSMNMDRLGMSNKSGSSVYKNLEL